ncbi:beta-ketoacyl synthase N-terminal-like domain-containing protein [Paenibacillus sp. HW567]|uniref:beta-ketoacyl synthase N-terminal-like domain-containing protein n=1 Tax=Paenibacillus sp. HW567 TaxID=1034769 RepID=UPI0003604732|nr:beta-ketoacyl synthase N-terminal-like domain-containing protein [Paenibacillus sp. HW567]
MLDDDAMQSKIAIIGMACRVPGADTPADFWHQIVNGVESIRTFKDEELAASGISADILNHPQYVKRGAVIENADYFDADFFRYTAKDAEITDPQHRAFLECAWEALEDAGCVQDLEKHLVGVYASSCISSYVLNLYSDPELLGRLGHVQIGIGNEKDFLASKVSYKLGLSGPSVNVQTACSSSLVAVHLASQSLLNGECDLALAGGVTIRSEQRAGYMYQKEGMVSPDGHCRVFDTDSKGTVFGNGLGIVVLKRLADAVRDRDNIQAVICGTAVNNDGNQRIGFTAPSPVGQAQVIHEALSVAGVAPCEISYIETHGTGTELGDAIEIKALKEVYQAEKSSAQFCAIGSVKPNIGHLDTAAGIIGLIKTALAMKNQVIPLCINHETPNPKLSLEESPFYVNTISRPWKEVSAAPKAGVSSFGIGGTNAHLILEEAPSLSSEASAQENHIFLFSAKTLQSLEHTCRKMADYFGKHPTLHPADVAYTLQTGREHFPYRQMVVSSSLEEAAQWLRTGPGQVECQGREEVPVALSFSAQQRDMLKIGYELYQRETRFASIIDAYFRDELVLHTLSGLDLPRIVAASPLEHQEYLYTELGQFIYQCALADYLISLGIPKEVLIAEGNGVFPALYVSGSLGMNDLIRMILIMQRVSNAAGEQQALLEIELASLLQTLPFQTSEAVMIVGGIQVEEEMLRRKGFWLSCGQDVSWPQTARLPGQGDRLLIKIGMESGTDGATEVMGAVSLLRQQVRGEPADSIFYRKLGEIWMNGLTVNWRPFYLKESRKRVTLPTYTFDRQRYWYERKEQVPKPAPRKKTPEKWLYRPVWKQYSVSPDSRPETNTADTLLLFIDDSELGQGIQESLLAQGNKVCTVKIGNRFGQLNPGQYEMDPGNAEHYLQVFRDVFQTVQPVWRIVHMWSSAEYLPSLGGFYSLLHMGKSFGMIEIHQQIQLTVVTSAFQSIMGNEVLTPSHAAAIGAVHVIPQELQNVRTALIEMGGEDIGKQDHEVVALLVEEILKPGPERFLAVRGRRKWVRTFEPVQMEASIALTQKPSGVHLILGGLGDIGLTAAKALAEQGAGTLILTGRAVFPPESEWQERLALYPETDRINQKIRKIMEIQERGAQVYLYQVQVSDEKRMNELFTDIERTHGRIQGVIYSAGTVVNDFFHNSISNITREMCEAEFEAKMRGLIILERVIRGTEIEYCMVNSSISTILGGIGLTAYTAANQFMNSFVQMMNQQQSRTRWMAVDWDAWNFSASAKPGGTTVNERMDQFIHPAEGGAIMKSLFQIINKTEHIVVSATELEPRLALWVNHSRNNEPRGKWESSKELSIEQLLRERIKDATGLANMGADENFFDAGITSIDIVGMNDSIQQYINRPILISSWYEYPTIRKLAGYLKGEEQEARSAQAFDRTEIVHRGMDKLKMLRNKGRELQNG